MKLAHFPEWGLNPKSRRLLRRYLTTPRWPVLHYSITIVESSNLLEVLG